MGYVKKRLGLNAKQACTEIQAARYQVSELHVSAMQFQPWDSRVFPMRDLQSPLFSFFPCFLLASQEDCGGAVANVMICREEKASMCGGRPRILLCWHSSCYGVLSLFSLFMGAMLSWSHLQLDPRQMTHALISLRCRGRNDEVAFVSRSGIRRVTGMRLHMSTREGSR